MNWDECLEKRDAIYADRDIGKSKSLIEMADERIIFFENVTTNHNIVFENVYSSLLEYLHALIIFEGFKVKNHICIGYYIRDVMKREDLFLLFDDCRYKRNSLVYYGNKMEENIAKDSVNKLMRLVKEIKLLIS